MIRQLALIVALLAFITHSLPFPPEIGFDTGPWYEPYQRLANLVCVNTSIGTEGVETPLVARVALSVAWCNWNCVAYYDDTKLDAITFERPLFDTPSSLHTTEQRFLCMIYCRALMGQATYGQDAGWEQAYRNVVLQWNLNPVPLFDFSPELEACDFSDTSCITQYASDGNFEPNVVGEIVAYEILYELLDDGWNQDGSLANDGETCEANCQPWKDYTGYFPVNFDYDLSSYKESANCDNIDRDRRRNLGSRYYRRNGGEENEDDDDDDGGEGTSTYWNRGRGNNYGNRGNRGNRGNNRGEENEQGEEGGNWWSNYFNNRGEQGEENEGRGERGEQGGEGGEDGSDDGEDYNFDSGRCCLKGTQRRWQPLLETNDIGFFFRQEHVTPHIGSRGKKYVLDEFPIADPPNYDYGLESELLLQRMKRLATNVTQRLMIEVFDNKCFTRGFVQQNYLRRFDFSYEEFTFFNLGISYAESEALLIGWYNKVIYDLVRPTTVIQGCYYNQDIEIWVKNRGLQRFKGKYFQPYIRTMPHSEFPSGSSCLCRSYADYAFEYAKEEYSSTQLFPFTEVPVFFPAGFSNVEDNFPSVDTLLPFQDVYEYAHLCGQSRLWGGMHFTASVPAGEQVCDDVGAAAYYYTLPLKGE